MNINTEKKEFDWVVYICTNKKCKTLENPAGERIPWVSGNKDRKESITCTHCGSVMIKKNEK